MFFFLIFVFTAVERVNYDIRVSIRGDNDKFDIQERIMNSSKDVVCKLISHIPVIMVTLGDKGLLVRIHACILETRLRVRTAEKKFLVHKKSLLFFLSFQKSIINRSFCCRDHV